MGVGPHEGWLLRLFGAHLNQAFGHTAYHVGSSLGEKASYRDVDVRLMLPDDEYAAYFGNPLTAEHDGPKLMMWNFAWTTLGRKLTRLPIDFQFQQTTLANDEFDGPRSALIILSSEIPCVLDASAARNQERNSS
jgi:hypothetical protein